MSNQKSLPKTKLGSKKSGNPLFRRTGKRVAKLTAVCSLLVASATLTSSCYETSGQIFIRHSVSFRQAEAPDCSIGSNDNIQLGGILDLAVEGTSYTNILSVATNLPATLNSTTLNLDVRSSPSNPNYGAGETSAVLFESYDVFLTDVDGGALEGVPGINNPRNTQVGGSVQNIQGTLAQNTALNVQTISSIEAAALRQLNPDLSAGLITPGATATVVINVRVNARTSGAGTIRTQIFAFPIDICVNCLINIGGQDGNCLNGQSPQPTADQNTCLPLGQDVPSTICQ